MPYCVVLECRNKRSTVNVLREGISYYRFPKDPNIKLKWIEATGRQNWFPTKWSTICSNHFNEKSIISTKGGLNYLIDNAIPVKKVFTFQRNLSPDPEPSSTKTLSEAQQQESKLDSTDGKLSRKHILDGPEDSKYSGKIIQRLLQGNTYTIKKLKRQNRLLRKQLNCVEDSLKTPEQKCIINKEDSLNLEKKLKLIAKSKIDDIPLLNYDFDFLYDDPEVDARTRQNAHSHGTHEVETEEPQVGRKCKECSGEIGGGCESRGEHARHYVLRVPGPRPQNQIKSVIKSINEKNKTILKELEEFDLTYEPEITEEDDIIVKEESGDPLSASIVPMIPLNIEQETVNEAMSPDWNPLKQSIHRIGRGIPPMDSLYKDLATTLKIKFRRSTSCEQAENKNARQAFISFVDNTELEESQDTKRTATCQSVNVQKQPLTLIY